MGRRRTGDGDLERDDQSAGVNLDVHVALVPADGVRGEDDVDDFLRGVSRGGRGCREGGGGVKSGEGVSRGRGEVLLR